MDYKTLILIFILIDGFGVALVTTYVPNWYLGNYTAAAIDPTLTGQNGQLSGFNSNDQSSSGQSSNSKPSSITSLLQTPTLGQTSQNNLFKSLAHFVSNAGSQSIAQIISGAGSSKTPVITPTIQTPTIQTPTSKTPTSKTPTSKTHPIITEPVIKEPIITPPVVTPPVVTPPADNSP
jgi:hypothetical protein